MKRLAVKRDTQPLKLLLLGVLLAAVAHGLVSGAVPLTGSQMFEALGQLFSGETSSQAAIIIGQLRFPRIMLAAIIGAILAASGAAMQGLFRNPLADPSLIGVTSGASLGASIMIVTSAGLVGHYSELGLLSFGAFLGGLIAVLVVYRLSTSITGTSVTTMLLSGIAITALAGSVGKLLEFYADNEMLRRISLWRMGGLDGANYPRLAIALLIGAIVLTVLPRYSTALNALLLGESEARHLGINVARVKLHLIFCVAIGVGTAVALAGTIAFVGLVVPHMVRMVTGPDHRRLFPTASLAGAILLVFADTIARLVVAPTELPVGVITALIGVPFFVVLLRRSRQYGMYQ